MKTTRWMSLGVMAMVSAAVAPAFAQGVPSARPIAPPVPLAAAPLPVALAPVQVDPQLKPALVQKAKFDPARLAPKLTVQNGRPVLQIANGRKYGLEPIGKELPVSPSLQMKQLPPKLLPYQQHIEAPLVAGRRIVKLPKLLIDHMNSQTAIRDRGPAGRARPSPRWRGSRGGRSARRARPSTSLRTMRSSSS